MNRQRKVAILEELLERIQGQVAFEDEGDDDAPPVDELRLEGADAAPPRLVTIAAAEPSTVASIDDEDDTMAAIRAARAFAGSDPTHETEPPDSGAEVASTAFDPAHERARRVLADQVEHALGGDSWGAIGFASEAPSQRPIPLPPRVPSVDVGGGGDGALARALAGAAEKRAIDSVPPSWREVADGLKPRPSSKPSIPPPDLTEEPSLAEAAAMLGTDEDIDDGTLVPGDGPAGESLSPTEHAPVSSRGQRPARPRSRSRHVSGSHLARRRGQGRRRSAGAFVVLGLFAFLVVVLVIRAARSPDGAAASSSSADPSSTRLGAASPARLPTDQPQRGAGDVGKLPAPPESPASGTPTAATAVRDASNADPVVPTATIARDAGRLLVRRDRSAEVYVNGVPAGATGTWIVVPCGLKHLRLAESATPAAGKSFPAWLTGGAPLVVPCRGAAAVDAPPDLDAAELERLRERDERG